MKKPRPKKYRIPRKGEEGRVCIFCGNRRALIRKYGLNICRKCFRERARELGFEKYGG